MWLCQHGAASHRERAHGGATCCCHPLLPAVYEPEYVALFEHLLDARPSGTGAWFVHVLHPSTAPPALLAEGAVSGLPRVGCCAEVKSVRRLDGRLAVEYEGTRRVRLVMLQQEAPFKVRRAARTVKE